MHLQYNIYFEVSAAIFTAFLGIYLRLHYNMRLNRNRLFLQLIVMVVICEIFDIATAITISYASMIPNWFNLALNTLYFALNGFLCFGFLCYSLLTEKEPSRPKRPGVFEITLLCIYLFLLAVNFIANYCGPQLNNLIIFRFDSNDIYVHGPIYPVVFIIPYLLLLIATVNLFKVALKLGLKQTLSMVLYTICCFSGMLIQLIFFPHVLLNLFSLSVVVVILMFYLVTPENEALTETMRELKIAKEEALSSSDLKSRFLTNMSLEIRTPINAILGMNEIIARESDQKEIRQYCKNISKAGASLMALVNDIMDIAKIESGKMEVNKTPYSLKKLLMDCIYLTEIRANAKDLDLHLEIREDTPDYLIGDSTKIKTCLMHLLTNAVKYTTEGSVTLHVDWSYEPDQRIVLLLTVKDTGIGIRNEDMDKLFDSFTHIEQEDGLTNEGNGLGLSLTRMMLDLMDGTIDVFSIYGKGSTFAIRIPQSVHPDHNERIGDLKAALAKELKSPVLEHLVAPSLRILAVDDVKINLVVLEGLLKPTQVQLDLAQSGEACVEMAYKNHYDLIFIDYIMPIMDGQAVLNEIRKGDCINHDTPAVVLTANTADNAREIYLKMGFADYISKPVSSEAIENSIRRTLGL